MRLVIVVIGILIASAHAQEPTAPIQSADTIAKAAHAPQGMTIATGGGAPAPTIYPEPRPAMKLGEIARAYRIIHATAPKATKIANDEAPIAEEPKEQK